ncbi:hypothetical protein AVEN_103746-1, partial [Araneus ventricosus]
LPGSTHLTSSKLAAERPPTTPRLSSDWPAHQLYMQPAPEVLSLTAHTAKIHSCSRLFLFHILVEKKSPGHLTLSNVFQSTVIGG